MHSSIKLLVATIPALASACVGPPVNGPTLDLIKGFESFRGDVYDDGAGNPTIGYGHLCPDWSCSDVTFPQPLTEETAAQLLAGDLIGYQDAVTNAFADPVTLNDNQYGALVSWTYNIGNGNMQSSDLVSRINAGEDVVAVTTDELPQWIHSNGQVMNGLIRRRQEELNLFNAPSNVGALPAPC